METNIPSESSIQKSDILKPALSGLIKILAIVFICIFGTSLIFGAFNFLSHNKFIEAVLLTLFVGVPLYIKFKKPQLNILLYIVVVIVASFLLFFLETSLEAIRSGRYNSGSDGLFEVFYVFFFVPFYLIINLALYFLLKHSKKLNKLLNVLIIILSLLFILLLIL